MLPNVDHVVYEDPAEALNINEDKWNSIVQQNYKNFHEEKEKARRDKLERNRVIQEEQRKQI